ncbi:hypothetical protein C2G38_2199647 [Gigaspora rosea]|uniref:Uncharacterized protein n=1 Tax=Gigaspora rosea TaxID=44941 RepID=A0A397USP1_9GLOM|nr:hypothetical protein C2G38_2199647 [Gigaspora rosea]
MDPQLPFWKNSKLNNRVRKRSAELGPTAPLIRTKIHIYVLDLLFHPNTNVNDPNFRGDSGLQDLDRVSLTSDSRPQKRRTDFNGINDTNNEGLNSKQSPTKELDPDLPKPPNLTTTTNGPQDKTFSERTKPPTNEDLTKQDMDHPKDGKPSKSKRKPIPRLRRRPQDKTSQDEEIKTGTTRVTRLEPKTSPAYDKIAKIRRPRKTMTPKTPEDTNYYDEVYEIQERQRL